MARIESVLFRPQRAIVSGRKVEWSAVQNSKPIDTLPQIFWADGRPWREANLWLLEQASERDIQLLTVTAKAVSILSYANWLETTSTDWWDFPLKKSERCLNRYRLYLIQKRDDSKLAPSTTTQRMRVAIQLYRWMDNKNIISTKWPMWKERCIGIRIQNSFGFERTITRLTNELAIPNRKFLGERLEDGLLPVSAIARDEIIEFAYKHASKELYYMLLVGFFCGMRIQTITDLKVQSLFQALPEPGVEGLYRISVGPDVTPPVATKFSISGQIWITKELLDELIEYTQSTRRLNREILATQKNKDLVFLTRFGNSYAQRGSDKSPALNVEIFHLREKAKIQGPSSLINFRFHQSRCTFATELARIAIRVGGAIHAIALVKDALLHKNESTTLKYIKFIENHPIKIAVSNSFTRDFLGLASRRNETKK